MVEIIKTDKSSLWWNLIFAQVKILAIVLTESWLKSDLINCILLLITSFCGAATYNSYRITTHKKMSPIVQKIIQKSRNCQVTKVLFDAQKINVETSLWRLMTWSGWLLVQRLIIHCKYKHHSLLKMFPRNHIKHPFGCSQPTTTAPHHTGAKFTF